MEQVDAINTQGKLFGFDGKLFALIFTLGLLFLAYLAIGFDIWTGASRNIFFELLFVFAGLVFGASALTVGRHRAFLVVPLAYLLLLGALPFLELSPVKPAVRAVSEIRPGMDETQVRSILDRHFPEKGRFKRPAIGALYDDHLGFALDPNDGRYNAAIVVVNFSSGKCVSA